MLGKLKLKATTRSCNSRCNDAIRRMSRLIHLPPPYFPLSGKWLTPGAECVTVWRPMPLEFARDHDAAIWDPERCRQGRGILPCMKYLHLPCSRGGVVARCLPSV